MSLLPLEDAKVQTDGYPPSPTREDSVDAGSPIVEIAAAEKAFSDTAITLSALPRAVNDAEKAPNSFDLAEYLEIGVRARKDHGLTKQQLGLTFRNLTVVGEGADASSIATVLTPLNPISWYSTGSRGTDFNIINSATGYVKEGEMLLVLGRPGAGCSTLLRVLANQRSTYKAVIGDVNYGGIPATEFGPYSGQAIYTAEEDVHFPTLTVSQTLSFALRTKTPGTRLPSQNSKRTFRSQVSQMLITMFGLAKQASTLVGNEFIRGLSGGERKRLTIAEAMTASAAINCWDCTTRGLDSASALDYTRSLRIMSDTLKKTTVATFYQAGEDIFTLFDNVLVLDKGRTIFFGPVKRAQAYFYELGFECDPRKSTPDFLTGITNPQERKIRPGYDAPHTSAELESAFLRSADHKELIANLSKYEARVAVEQPASLFRLYVAETKMAGARSVYTSNFAQQVKALTIREFQLLAGDSGALIGKAFSVISKGFIYATVFLHMPVNSDGAFLRGGALFASVLFNSLISLGDLPNAMRGRRILQKHKSYSMFHPSSYHIASVVANIPIIFVQVFCYTLCCYFIFGLQLHISNFLIFILTLWLTSLVMTDIFKICGVVGKSYVAASQTANLLLILLLCYTGFLIPYVKMHPWLIWVHWINPMAYAFKAIFSNEMRGLIFPCRGLKGVVPSGGAYDASPEYQACLLKGQQGNSLFITGSSYLSAAYGYETSQMWLDIFVVFLMWISAILINCIALEMTDLFAGGYTRQVYKKGKAPRQNVEEPHPSGLVVVQIKVGEETNDDDRTVESSRDEFATETEFAWRNIDYTVPVKAGSRQLLDGIGGWIRPGEMTAL
ncbi:ABC-2 type transporter-domain-containing protein [Blyttiomyces helicus]|uniref:ABC-2 type transporter-domain-containing protein n=1 Tax=Blyttiomyces helicus TaxID=388810 RepID=A0A4P9WAY0_9FUNG|nr:ABC-2 type transporter-domain-containing protein [Blyttiomyces helicus]|eukprot:RKO88050.1 ABC-2 type transporter-domain-containing protein [Blyttiomyces helicus]